MRAGPGEESCQSRERPGPYSVLGSQGRVKEQCFHLRLSCMLQDVWGWKLFSDLRAMFIRDPALRQDPVCDDFISTMVILSGQLQTLQREFRIQFGRL